MHLSQFKKCPICNCKISKYNELFRSSALFCTKYGMSWRSSHFWFYVNSDLNITSINIIFEKFRIIFFNGEIFKKKYSY